MCYLIFYTTIQVQSSKTTSNTFKNTVIFPIVISSCSVVHSIPLYSVSILELQYNAVSVSSPNRVKNEISKNFLSDFPDAMQHFAMSSILPQRFFFSIFFSQANGNKLQRSQLVADIFRICAV